MKKLSLFLLCVFVWSSCDDTGVDPGPQVTVPKISISSVTLFEGNENQIFTFTVNLNTTTDKVVTVDYNTEEVSAGIGDDFLLESGTLSIPVGAQQGEIRVNILADEWKESDEQFKVILSNAVNATIINGEGIGTIRNDDDMILVDEDGYSTPLTYPGLSLSWNDEFDGSSIDPMCWTHEQGNHGWGNQEWQNYTDRSDNSYIDDGKLIIEAKEESFGGSDYTSARLVTQGKKMFTHGRVDIRAILPEGQGIWPALWMLGSNFSSIGWPACGEIDIMELVGHEASKVHGTAHWGPQGQSWSSNNGGSYTLPGNKKFSEEFNVFSIIWSPGKIEYYVNDNKYFTLNQSDVNVTYPFDQDFFFIFNIAVGGLWPGYPDASTVFPQRMIVDYIRVFQ